MAFGNQRRASRFIYQTTSSSELFAYTLCGFGLMVDLVRKPRTSQFSSPNKSKINLPLGPRSTYQLSYIYKCDKLYAYLCTHICSIYNVAKGTIIRRDYGFCTLGSHPYHRPRFAIAGQSNLFKVPVIYDAYKSISGTVAGLPWVGTWRLIAPRQLTLDLRALDKSTSWWWSIHNWT